VKIEVPLFESEHICLAPIDHEKDAEIESWWTQDAEYLRLVDFIPARPLSPAQLKKKYEAIEKDMDEKNDPYYFTIRMRSDDRLIGFARLSEIERASGVAVVRLGIGELQDRRHGYGTEALDLLLRFAFAELNLYRLTAYIQEYNQPALHFFKEFGFVEEVCIRQALYRDGRRWDLFHLGLLKPEWETGHLETWAIAEMLRTGR
jgi:RimJ/RimL family protein N-acetyltransferase